MGRLNVGIAVEWLEKDIQEPPPLVVEVKKIAPPKAQPQVEAVAPEFDEETKRKKEAGLMQCPTCGKWDVYRAVIEDGGQGDWCPNCKKSLQKMRPAPEISDSQKADKLIKKAWITGIIWGLFNVALFIVAISTITEKITPYIIIDVFIIFGLSFGIYKKMRSCAILMLVYVIGDMFYKIAITNMTIFGLVFLIFIRVTVGYFIFRGIQGAFLYHKIIKPADSQG